MSRTELHVLGDKVKRQDSRAAALCYDPLSLRRAVPQQSIQKVCLPVERPGQTGHLCSQRTANRIKFGLNITRYCPPHF